MSVTKISRADPVARRRVLLLLVGFAVCGVLLKVGADWFRSPLAHWVLADPAAADQRLGYVLFAMALLMSTPLLALAVFFYSLGRRTVRSGEFPPPRWRVVRDTPVISGAAAVSRGRLLLVLAALCLLAAAGVATMLWFYLKTLTRDLA
jgi:hypothetical protein